MAFLEKFSDEEKDLLVSFPYRAGMYISKADDTGDDDSSIGERLALNNIIEKKATGLYESAFVHEIMSEAKLRDRHWPEWQKQTESIESDGLKAIDIISGKMIAHDVEAYKENVMQIATAVALSYREFDHHAGFFKKMTTHIGIAIDKFLGGFKGEHYVSASLLNISIDEDVALSKLAKALGYKDGMAIPEK